MSLQSDYRNIFQAFQNKRIFSEEEISKALGYKNLREYRQVYESGQDFPEERVAHLISIPLGLMGLFGDNYREVRGWLEMERDFEGLRSSPLEMLTSGPLENLKVVSDTLLRIRGL